MSGLGAPTGRRGSGRSAAAWGGVEEEGAWQAEDEDEDEELLDAHQAPRGSKRKPPPLGLEYVRCAA